MTQAARHADFSHAHGLQCPFLDLTPPPQEKKGGLGFPLISLNSVPSKYEPLPRDRFGASLSRLPFVAGPEEGPGAIRGAKAPDGGEKNISMLAGKGAVLELGVSSPGHIS